MFRNYLLHAFPWDLAILLLITGGLAAALFGFVWWKRHPEERKRRAALAVASAGVLFSLVIFYGSFIEPQIIVVTEGEVSLPLSEDLRIVVLSDFHVGPYKGRRFLKGVVARVNALEPDLILLAGDYILFDAEPADDLVPLKDLHPRYGVFGVLGNHEYSCYASLPFFGGRGIGPDRSLPVRRTLERSGVTVLRNEWREVPTATGRIFIAGVDDLCSGRADIVKALPEVLKQSPLILLSHSPDIILEGRAKRAHLIVAGHTHGGQIRLPILGSVVRPPTQLGRAYDQGLFPVDANTTLAITRGIGESSPRARLFAPPEILLLHARGVPRS